MRVKTDRNRVVVASVGAMAGLLLVTSAAHAAITTNLQGYYKLDETSSAAGTTIVNSGSVAKNRQIVSGVTAGVTGVVGTAYTFDDGRPPATNDGSVVGKAEITPNASTIVDNLAVRTATPATGDTVGVNRLTIGAWIRPVSNKSPTTGSDNRSTIVATNTDFQLTLTPGTANSSTTSDLFFNFRNSGGANVAANSAAATTHVAVGASAPWQYVAMTRDGATFTFYTDGVAISTTTSAANGASDPFYQRAHNT